MTAAVALHMKTALNNRNKNKRNGDYKWGEKHSNPFPLSYVKPNYPIIIKILCRLQEACNFKITLHL